MNNSAQLKSLNIPCFKMRYPPTPSIKAMARKSGLALHLQRYMDNAALNNTARVSGDLVNRFFVLTSHYRNYIALGLSPAIA